MITASEECHKRTSGLVCGDLYYGSASQLLGPAQRQDPRDTVVYGADALPG